MDYTETIEDYNFKFDVSVSLNPSNVKPTDREIGKMRYKRTNVTCDEFIDYIENGYCIAHVYTDNDCIFNNTTKTKKNFRYTNYISIDIDDSQLPMEQYINQIQCKPTFAYHTYSDGIKGYRYRLVYVFKEPIYSDEYRCIYENIKSCAGISNLKDDCMKSIAQCMIGNGSNASTINTHHLFIKDDFMYTRDTSDDCPVKMHNIYREREKQYASQMDQNEKPLDKSFFYHLMSMKPSEFLQYYCSTYSIINSSPLILSDDKSYYTFPTPYYEIDRGYRWDSFVKDNGEVKPFTKEKRIPNGQGRRRKLFICAVIKCRIKPDISIEELVYNMVWERQTFYDNSDNELSNSVLADISKRALSSGIIIAESKHPNFKVNKEWAAKQGLNANQAKRLIAKKINDSIIGEWYDLSKSMSENLKWAKENGIKISKGKLWSWCKENVVKNISDGKGIQD